MRVPGGLRKQDEQRARMLLRDTRTVSKRIYDFFESNRNSAIFLIFMACAVFVFKALADLLFIGVMVVFAHSCSRKQILPFRLPKRANMLDYNDLKAGTSKPQMARGICFYGNEADTNKELWFSDTDMRTHTLMFGSTGSGKTEAMISLAYNALIQGSGFIYVDGKADNTLFVKIYSLARSVGREDDVLVINFMTGARDIVGPQERRLSNTMNPFTYGSSGMLSQLIISMMAAATHTPDGDMWKGRAMSFIEALMKLLVYMRDQGKILLDANTIRKYFELPYLESVVIDKVFPRFDQEPVSLVDAPALVMEPLYNYLVNLPGYDKSRKGKQVSQVSEQHGFITMQLVRVFSSLADAYGHILRTPLAEVDLKDVVLNRRILVVLLPALEKSPDELGNLGKIIIASLRSMMAAGLGEEVEGSYKELIARKPTNAETPFMCILDEYGYYAVNGFAVVPAQARSLGFSVIFAGQDLPAFKKASVEEAASIGANTNIKIAMKIEDPADTWEFFSKTAGEAYIMKVDSFKVNPESLVFSYQDAATASAEKRGRITLGDLKEQREGEMHIFFKSSIVRAKVFNANPKPVEEIQLNHFLKIDKPITQRLIEFERHLDHFSQLVDNDNLGFAAPEFSADIDLVVRTLREDIAPTLIERGVSALLAFYNRSVGVVEEEEIVPSGDMLNIFAKPILPDLTKRIVPTEELTVFSSALLQRGGCNQHIQLVERLFGKTESYASSIANEIIRDMELSTNYPPSVGEKPVVENIVKLIRELSDSLRGMK